MGSRNKVGVKTTLLHGDLISQVTYGQDQDGKIREISRELYSLKEKQLRNALMALGWKPPK